MNDSGLVQGRITDADVDMMRQRIGYPNPTIRRGAVTKPWNTTATGDAIRRWAESIGDLNPLYNDEDYAAGTRWKTPIAPPGFEWSMGVFRFREVPDALQQATRKALRGVQLYHSGAQYTYYRPVQEGTKLFKAEWVADVKEKQSKFATRSVIVNNTTSWWDQNDKVAILGERWFVHAERKPVIAGEKKEEKKPKDVLEPYTEEQMAEIEACYDAEFIRGKQTLFLEDAKVGQDLPKMVKGPLTITDQINFYMGAGWTTYGAPPFRLGYENRKKLRGMYSKNGLNVWDSVQRVHWDIELAHQVGVKYMYDIGPMRLAWLCHYLTNFAGDDGWVYRYRYELRNFNYVGDTTWFTGKITAVRVDPELGPLIELEIFGTNQRGQHNMTATATILVASREHGPVKLPESPPMPQYRAGF